MYSKEQIIGEIKRVAEKLGVQSLKVKDFEMNSTIPLSTLKYYLGSWKQALQEAGLDSKDMTGSRVKLDKGDDNELLRDLIRMYEKYGETPSIVLIQKDGKYNERLYTSKWKSVNEAFTLAKKKFLKKEDAGRVNQEKQEKIGDIPDSFLDEDDLGDEPIDNVLDHTKIAEVLEQEKTEEIHKGQTMIQDPIDFSAMIDEIEKEEKELAKIAGAAVAKDDGKKEPVKPVIEDIESDEMDPNEITKVQERVDISLIKKPSPEKVETKPKPARGDAVDFSDLGLDEVTIKTDEERAPDKKEEKINLVQTDDKTKEIKIERGKETTAQNIFPIPQTIPPKISKKKRREVGEPINFRGLRLAPLNEEGVLYLFGIISHELGFIIESIKAEFPAGEGKRCFDKKNNRWEYMYIDFEFRSSQFKEKGYNEEECDLVVCWIHDWEECPVEILELRSTINYLSVDKKQ